MAGMALSCLSIKCRISFATFWAITMIAMSSLSEKLWKVLSICFVVVSSESESESESETESESEKIKKRRKE